MRNRLANSARRVAEIITATHQPKSDVSRAQQTVAGLTPHFDLNDVDSLVAQGLSAAASRLHPVADEFFGVRVAVLQDPYGRQSHLASRKEDVSSWEVQRRIDVAYG